MAKNRRSIDGFIPRRPQEQDGARRIIGEGRLAEHEVEKPDYTEAESTITNQENAERQHAGTIRSEIDDSLRAIEDDQPKKAPKPPKRKRSKHGKHKPGKKPVSRRRKIIKWVSLLIVAALLIYGGLIAYKAITSSNQLFNGNVLGLLKGDPLKQDANGRSNVLIVGTTDDDPNHPGNNLTDTIIILSVDQNNKNAFMFSVPRDLYVDYERACPAGMSGKINSYFSCINDGSTPDLQQKRLQQTQDFMGNIFGLDIQYGVQVNSVVVRDLVNAVDGIDVNIQGSNGDPGILDRNFDWQCNYTCYKVKYDNGVHHLNGQQAMFLAMARGNTAPTYGLSNSNFDREQNQQKIIKALQKKALSTGTFTSYSKVTDIMESLGDNLRTNFKTSEVRTLVSLATEIQTSDIQSINLQAEDEKLFTTQTMPTAGSVVIPASGTFDYSQIQLFLDRKLSNDPVAREGASVAVYNGGDTPGAAQAAADALTQKGVEVTTIANSPLASQAKSSIYVVNTNSKTPKTAEYLKSRFGATTTDSLGFATPIGADYVLIVGRDYQPPLN